MGDFRPWRVGMVASGDKKRRSESVGARWQPVCGGVLGVVSPSFAPKSTPSCEFSICHAVAVPCDLGSMRTIGSGCGRESAPDGFPFVVSREGADAMKRRTFLGTALACVTASPLFAALRGGRWDEAAEVLEK